MNKYEQYQLFNSINLNEKLGINLIACSLITISVLFGGLIVWASLTKVKEIAVAKGEIEPKGYLQNIQHFDGGIIDNIIVQEGELIKKGQLLLELRDTGSDEDLYKSEIKEINLIMHTERLRSI